MRIGSLMNLVVHIPKLLKFTNFTKFTKNLSTLTAAIKPRAELSLLELCRGEAVKKISKIFNSQLSTQQSFLYVFHLLTE